MRSRIGGYGKSSCCGRNPLERRAFWSRHERIRVPGTAGRINGYCAPWNASAAFAGTLATMATESRGARRSPWGPALTMAVTAALLLAGCTSGGASGPRPSRLQGRVSSPTMTAVPEAAQCVTRQDLGRGADVGLPFKGLFTGQVAHGVDINDEFTPGPDSTDAGRCGAVLPGPGPLWCAQPAPWASMGLETFTIASGATRVRRLGISTDVSDTRGAQASRVVSYVELELGNSDPKGAADFVTRAFQECADGAVAHVEGLPAIAGDFTSTAGGAHDADAVAFLTSKRVAWVILDGRPWTPAERKQALSAIAAHLRQA